MGRIAGFLAEVLGLARLVAELVALKRAFGAGAASEDPLGGGGGGRPADPRPPDPPQADARGPVATPAVPGPDPLGRESARDVGGRAPHTLG